MSGTVKLERYFGWRFKCPACGFTQSTIGVIAELSAEEREELETEYGVMFRTGDWVRMPAEVTCKVCLNEAVVENHEGEPPCH